MISTLGVDDFVDALRAFRDALRLHETTINHLNVFPVPDGDTGTNMLRTVDAAIDAVAECATSDPAMTLGAVARGSLMGARGNSGVILSQILRGLAGSLGDGGGLDGSGFAGALEHAADAAYAAVQKPVEGTLLTVARSAGVAARRAVEDGTLGAVAHAARDGARTALWSTPDLLPVLAAAGVVDAGGAGLLLLFDAVNAVVSESPVPDTLDLPEEVAALVASSAASGPFEQRPPVSPVQGELRYEVMFLLEAEDAAIDRFRAAWAEIGDSIVVVGGDGVYSCHIHTDTIGPAIDAGVTVGRPRSIQVTDLREQVGALEGEAPPRGTPIGDTYPHPAVSGVVAVGGGAGVEEILRSLGVGVVVPGGQSMNPSTAEMLAGIDAVVGREVLVLPNNANIIPVDEAAAALCGRADVVVPTTSVQAGIAALVSYDPGATAAENADRMCRTIAHVVTGEVTRAARPANSVVGPIVAGSWIGVSSDGVVATGASCAVAAAGLVDVLVSDEHEILTLIEGADAPEGEIAAFVALVEERHPSLTIEHHHGGQPVYPMLLALE